MSATADLLIQTFPSLLQHLDGDKGTKAVRPSSQAQPADQSIVFIADPEHLSRLLDSSASILVVHNKIAQTAKAANVGRKTLLSSPNPQLSMALVNAKFFASPHVGMPFEGHRVHPTAVIAKGANLASNVIVGPHAVIAGDVQVLEGTFIGAHVVIEPNTTIGKNCFIHPHVYIGHSCRIGDRVEIQPHSTVGSDGYGYAQDEKGNHYRIPHYGELIIEEDVHIGAGCAIDRGTFEPAKIGAGSKIDNLCHFAHNVRTGKNCLFTAGFMAAGSATIGDNCVFGGRTSVNGHTTIVSGCTFGPHSGVTGDVKVPGVYSGFPPIPMRQYLKMAASLEHLPDIRKKVSRLLKHLGLQEEKGNE